VVLATFVSTYSEFKNEETFQKLQADAAKIKCTVFRNGGDLTSVLISDIVVGDFVLLDAGAMIPADGVLVHGKLLVNQQSLSGEAKSVEKSIPPEFPYNPFNLDDFNDTHLLFRGSVVDDGEAILRVTRTGKSTLYGKLTIELTTSDDRESPLQYKLSKLAAAISKLGYIGATCIAVSFLFKQYIMDPGWSISATSKYLFSNPLVAFQDFVNACILAIIIIVVAVPEGLPMMIAIVLSLNMRKLLNDQVLVRKLLGIETAGSLSILFCDKTGTLTMGEFKPEVFLSGDMDRYKHIGEAAPNLARILAFTIQESTSSIRNANGQILGGNSTDKALVSFIPQALWLKAEDEFTTVEQSVLFNSMRKYSASQVRISDNFFQRFPYFVPATNQTPYTQSNFSRYITIVKGAPEILLPLCTTYFKSNGEIFHLHDSRRAIEREIEEISRRGVRVILIATTKQSLKGEIGTFREGHGQRPSDDPNPLDEPPSDLTLVGIMGVNDQVRPNTKQAIKQCHAGGIKTVMMTGDKIETAIAVAQEIGLLDEDKRYGEFENPENGILTSSQLQRMSNEQLYHLLPRIKVIARALPTDKSKLVKISQMAGHVVGMTGDGVNDSAALRLADVGFAMGSGAEVAKEASDIVILDDNFSSIAKAILYGRTIFKSIRKFIVFQSTVNLASTLIVFLGPFMGFDFPLSLIQLLWVNIVMDTLAAIAYGGGPPLMRYMTQKPIKRDALIINLYMWTAIIANGFFIAILCIIYLTWDPIEQIFIRDGDENTQAFMTGFFCFFIFITNFNSFNVRTKELNIFDNITENKNFMIVVSFIFIVQITFTYIGGNLLRTVGLTITEWIYVIGFAALIIPFDMIRKVFIVPKANNYFKQKSRHINTRRLDEIV